MNYSKMDSHILEHINDQETENLSPVLVFCGLMMLLGIGGNSLVVYVYWRRMKSSAKRTFILALAILDLTVCILVIPFEMFDLLHQATFTEDAPCKVMRLLEYAAILSAGFVLVAVSFERYHFLCKAFQEFTTRKAKWICAACVCIALIVSAPTAMLAGSKTRQFVYEKRNMTGYECSMGSETDSDRTIKRIYYYCLSVIFLGCFAMFVVIYSIIGRLLWKYQNGTLVLETGHFQDSDTSSAVTQANTIASTEQPSGQSKYSFSSIHPAESYIHGRRHIKSAGSIVIFFSVTVVFIISFLPHITIRLLMFLGWDYNNHFERNNGELFYNFVVRSYMISNVANPFIYSILNKAFRKELTKTFKKIKVCLIFSKVQNGGR